MFYGRPSLSPSSGQPYFSGMLISPIAPKAVWCIYVDHIQLWAVAVYKLLFETMVVIMPTTIQPVIIENNVQSSGLGFPRERCRELLECQECHIKSATLCLREQQSYPGATWASIEDNHIKRRPCPSTYLGAEEFTLSCPGAGWSWSGELDALSLSTWIYILTAPVSRG